jgi:hypothetical protein
MTIARPAPQQNIGAAIARCEWCGAKKDKSSLHNQFNGTFRPSHLSNRNDSNSTAIVCGAFSTLQIAFSFGATDDDRG